MTAFGAVDIRPRSEPGPVGTNHERLDWAADIGLVVDSYQKQNAPDRYGPRRQVDVVALYPRIALGEARFARVRANGMVQWSEARPACRSNRSSGPI